MKRPEAYALFFVLVAALLLVLTGESDEQRIDKWIEGHHEVRYSVEGHAPNLSPDMPVYIARVWGRTTRIYQVQTDKSVYWFCFKVLGHEVWREDKVCNTLIQIE